MNEITSFCRHFAQLVWLLAHEGDNRGGQKDALRRTVADVAENGQEIVSSQLNATAAGWIDDPMARDLFGWVTELALRMSAHSVTAIEFELGTPPQDLLGVARALAEMPVPGDDGEAFDEAVIALASTKLAVHLGRDGFVRRATPPLGQGRFLTPGHTPMRSIAVIETPAASPTIGAEQMRLSRMTPAAGAVIQEETSRMVQADLVSSNGAPKLNDLLSRLDGAGEANVMAKTIDDIARDAEERARAGQWVDLAVVLDRLYQRSDSLNEGEVKRAYHFAIRRLEKPMLMRGLAQLLPRHREMRDAVTGTLRRTGEVGADVLIDLLINSESTTERHAYRNALAQCPAAVPTLVHLLSDTRWYVVRNAVELLAELAPPDADVRLASAMGHSESRVRRAAAAGLAKLGTQRAVLTLLQYVQDPSAAVRLQVGLGLGAVRNPRAVPWLIEALDREGDNDVQAAYLSALGRMPTEDSVARLARAAEPGGILVRKSPALRLQAIEALGEARTHSAQTVLRGLLHDRDRDVREAAGRQLRGDLNHAQP